MSKEIISWTYGDEVPTFFDHSHTIFDCNWEIEDMLETTPIEQDRKSVSQSFWNGKIHVMDDIRSLICTSVDRFDIPGSDRLEKLLRETHL